MEQHDSTAPVAEAKSRTPLLDVRGLKKYFAVKNGVLPSSKDYVYAVDDVSFHVETGETLGVVGESGCGKSTVGRTILRLIEPTAGQIIIDNQDISAAPRADLRSFRRQMQIIFQDPYSSLNPRMTAGQIVGEPLRVHNIANGSEIRDRVADLFERVGLRKDQINRYPHEFSGGQRQRIGIARALALGPKLIIADEPVSALDVSIQAQVINLLMDLQDEFGIAFLFIAHDLSVVERLSHRVAVMYLGRIVEIADRKSLFTNPQHPYTQALLSAVPVPDPSIKKVQRTILKGDIPSPMSPPPGCMFHTRCPVAKASCKIDVPQLKEVAPGHQVSCHLR
ncbi:dipeptide ABC transporter ATP-binding protein [Thalassospiraceae bacterium LMO-JJ14]|nr:dipeptide ABC transporter ATP-binding protein [Thalassospiraceae bacterium LMO-JJ14]